MVDSKLKSKFFEIGDKSKFSYFLSLDKERIMVQILERETVENVEPADTDAAKQGVPFFLFFFFFFF